MSTYPDIRPKGLPSGAFVLNPGEHASFVAIDSDGSIVDVSPTREEAISSLRDIGPGYVQFDDSDEWVEGEDERPVTRNPAGDNPQRALERAGLSKLDIGSVLNIDLSDAHRALLPYFQALRRSGSAVEIKAYQSPEGMAARFLGQNYKTAKTTPEDPSLVMGLTLLPADRLTVKYLSELDTNRHSQVNVLVRDLLRKKEAIVSNVASQRDWSPRKRRSQWTMCDGSTDECKNSCLVYTGRNAMDVYNNRRKAVGTLALLEQPEAFCRMLIEAIRLHTRSESCQGMRPYVRLNVLSDVPWELLIPGMFDFFSPRTYARHTVKGFGTVVPPMFYDYTKVANRNPPSNYDLTFSFSGRNEALARSELARGHRVAVVFLAMKPKGAREKWEPFRYTGKAAYKGAHRPQADLPDSFWGFPVKDGDISDVRPRDPKRCIVGLRWKTPSGKRVDPTAEDFRFVTRAFHVSGEVISEPTTHEGWSELQSIRHSNPGVMQSDEGMEYLVSPVTPRYQPIDENG